MSYEKTTSSGTQFTIHGVKVHGKVANYHCKVGAHTHTHTHYAMHATQHIKRLLNDLHRPYSPGGHIGLLGG